MTYYGSSPAETLLTGAQIADNAISSSKIANGSIIADDILNNTITAAKLVNNTITATQIANNTLTSTQVSPGTIPVLLSTLTANNSATISFTSIIDTTKWRHYKVIIRDLGPVSDAVSLFFRVSTDNGSTWKQGAGEYTNCYSHFYDNSYNGGGNTDTKGAFFSSSLTNARLSLNGELNLYINSIRTATVTNSTYNHSSLGWMLDNTSSNVAYVANAIQFFMGSGNITSGTFQLWGFA